MDTSNDEYSVAGANSAIVPHPETGSKSQPGPDPAVPHVQDPTAPLIHPIIQHALQGVVHNGTVDWFEVPFEIRTKVYQELTIDVIVNVDATKDPTVFMSRSHHTPLNGPLGHIVVGPLPPNNNWLTISKRFFNEARNELWSTMKVLFERRWDFLTAFANRSLQVDPRRNAPLGLDTFSLYPLATDVFQRLHHLHFNLTETTDFEGTVTFQEGKRVMLNILTIARQSMPSLRNLVFAVDKKARIHDQLVIFLPLPWFLQALLAIEQLKLIKFIVGGDWQGWGSNRAVARHCIRALNDILKDHLRATSDHQRLTYRIRSGRRLQARVGRMMQALVQARAPEYHAAWRMLDAKCHMLELANN